MASLVRCPNCDTFIKAARGSSCPFCSETSTASQRNPLPGLVLAAAVAAMPSCSSNTPANDPAAPPTATPVSPVDDAASPAAPVPEDPQPAIYGAAPSDPEPPRPAPEPVLEPPTDVNPKGATAAPGQDVDVYGIAPE